MPSIDYSKTKIYKFQCKTDAEKPAFFGHCTHIPNMKYRLNNDIINGKDTVISNTIRENGSLDNWDLTIIEVFDTCLNKKQADDRVAYFREEYLVNKRLEKSANWLEKSAVFCDDTEPSEKTIDNSKKTCTFCSKVFSKRSNMLVHQKTSCKLKNSSEIIEKLNKRIDEQQTQLNQQQEKLNKLENVPTTVNHNKTQNIQTNNNIIIELGKENFEDILSTKQKLKILEKRYASIEYFIEQFHCNPKYPQFQCLKIPSLTKSHCDVFSQKHNMFIAKNANDAVEQLVDCRVGDIQIFLHDTPGVSENTEKAVRDMVEKIEKDAKYKRDKCSKIKMNMYSGYRKKLKNL